MSKRAPGLKRNARDFYPTPAAAVPPLLPHIEKGSTFAEPCAGKLDLVWHLEESGLWCKWASDVQEIKEDGLYVFGMDALDLVEGNIGGIEYIITNPPWDRSILHPMIDHFRSLRPTWLLLDADWMHTRQASEHMKYCAKVVSVGRLKWIPESKYSGKDNCAWYLFHRDKTPTIFIGR